MSQVKLVVGKVVFTASVETELEQVIANVLAQEEKAGEVGHACLPAHFCFCFFSVGNIRGF